MQKIALTHTASKNKDVIKAMLACINSHPSKGGFIIVANANAAAVTTGTEYNAAFNGLGLSTVAITQDTDLTPLHITGTSGGTTVNCPAIQQRMKIGIACDAGFYEAIAGSSTSNAANDLKVVVLITNIMNVANVLYTE